MPDPTALQAVADALRGATHVMIGAHVDPDGDAVGSCLGLAHALDILGVPCTLVLASGEAAPSTYAFLPGAERFVPAQGLHAPPVFVSLDSPHVARLGAARALAATAGTLVLIDHHPDAEPEGALNVLDAEAAATGSIVWDLLPYLGVAPNEAVASCLYTALLTDTGRFSYANTTAATLATASAMVAAGARPHDIYRAVYENRSAGAQQLVGRVLSRVTLANGGHVAYSWIDDADIDETGALPEETENLVDYVRALGSIDVAILIKAGDTVTKASLRAKTDADVGAAARALGGGGHRAAAGLRFDGTMDQLLERLLPLLPGAE